MPFSKFQVTIVKNVIMAFEGSYEVLLRHKYFWSTHFWEWNGSPLKDFWNFHGNAFCFSIFSKWKKYFKLLFKNTFKMYCCALLSSKFNLHKQAIFKLRAVEYAVSFFSIFFVYFNKAFDKNLKKLSFFKTNVYNSSQGKVYYRMFGCQTLSSLWI